MSGHAAISTPWLSGLLFAGIGLVGLLTSIPHFAEFAVRARTETREQAYFEPFGGGVFGGGYSYAGNGKVLVWFSGFESGADALFFMCLFSMGVGIGVCPFLAAAGRQNLSLLLAVAWHGLGIGTCVCYILLAPRPYDSRPFLAVGIFEWLGLIPIALGVRKEWRTLHASVWNLWGGIVPGVIIGGIAGVLIDLGTNLPSHEGYMQPFYFSNGVYGSLAGGLATGIVAIGITWRRRCGIGMHPAKATATE